ncbi:uncharacterized protein [Drosophila bipectinata]|uniref:uncharacterized protein n=1 Tax=Drosophila bipectinata TaxID=42026 RepID=UPI0038B2E117
MFHNMSSPPTIAATRSRRLIKPNPKYTSDDIDDLSDITEDDDDSQLHKSDDDDDDDDLSDGEFQEKLRPRKLPSVKRGPGRPLKASKLANTAGSSVASKMGASSGRPTPSSLQQLLRNDSDSDIPVARKRFMGASGEGSVSLDNGATKMRKLRKLPRSSSVTFKINTGSGNRSVPGKSRSAGSGGRGGALSAAIDSKLYKSDDGDDVPTFTIVNIDDIINKEDPSISRANINIAAATAAVAHTSGATGKKRGRPRTRGIPPSSSAVEKSIPSSVGFSLRSLSLPKRSNTAKKSRSGYNQNFIPMKRQPRILNTEMGKKAQAINPLMNMEDELEPDLDFDNDEPRAKIVKRKNVKKIASTSTRQRASAGNARPERKLSQLLHESGSESSSGELTLYKKPGISIQLCSKENNQQEDDLKDSDGADAEDSSNSSSHTEYFPPETTTYGEEDGCVVKKITCYESWHVIIPWESPPKTTEHQRTFLALPLVKLANAAGRIKMPSSKWSRVINLYKVPPTLMQRQTMTIFTGDLKPYNIPEEERDKYQPSCVLFRRSTLDRTKCRVSYDRAVVFKNKWFYANIDGRHVNLLGSPKTVATLKDVEILLDIVDHLTLDSEMVEIINANCTGRYNH